MTACKFFRCEGCLTLYALDPKYDGGRCNRPDCGRRLEAVTEYSGPDLNVSER